MRAKVFKTFADITIVVQSAELFSGKTKVLIVDDDSDLRLTLCEYLETRRFRVSSARNGSEAIRMFESGQQFDIVFTDLMMPPGPNGLEVLKAVRNLQPHTQVVVMTGYSSIETAIESIRLGAFDYLTKPFQVAELEITANRILEHLILLEDNRVLSQKVHSLTEKFSTIDSRLERIDSMVGRLGAILLESPRH
jgi:two-component system, NtrC family, response regulator AtoC